MVAKIGIMTTFLVFIGTIIDDHHVAVSGAACLSVNFQFDLISKWCGDYYTTAYLDLIPNL